MTRNARFWTYANGGPVKITLRPEQSLTYYKAESADEGWSSETVTWTHEDTHVLREWCDDGRDCDGRLTRSGEDQCSLDELQSGGEPYIDGDDPSLWEGVVWPAWEEAGRRQYDEYAEMAGY